MAVTTIIIMIMIIIIIIACHFDALFLINVFCGTKQWPSVLATVSIRVPTWSIRNFNTFSCSFSHCPSVRCVFAEIEVFRSTYIFSKSYLSVKVLSDPFFLAFSLFLLL
jgi:hypothetical protein